MALDTVIAMEKITKSFPGVKALDNVDFDLRPKEVHALVGENGAGKSTLMNILGGVIPPTQGKILVDGKQAVIPSPIHAKRMGISFIHQELMLAESVSAVDNIFLGNMPKTPFGFIDWKKARRKANEILKRLQVSLDIDCPVHDLSIAQRQMIEIAKAIALDARILIFDEPSSFLNQDEQDILFNLIDTLRSGGASIVYISHRLEEVFTIADRVTVLKDGQKIGVNPTSELNRKRLIEMMTGREFGELFPKRAEQELGRIILKVENLSWNNKVMGIDFEVREGEILGIYGLIGSGRTELAKLIFGHFSADEGRILIDDREVKLKSPEDAIKSGVAYVPEDRRREGLVTILSILDNTNLVQTNLNRKSLFTRLNKKDERRRTENLIDRLAIRTSGPPQLVRLLSGGNQQKVVLAKWLNGLNSKVVIFDEPTRGVDVGAKSQIYRIMYDLAGEGQALILISSELPEVIGMADRILVMGQGRIIDECRGSVTEEEVLACALRGT
jgi:ribose transport system ATP-binding protein